MDSAPATGPRMSFAKGRFGQSPQQDPPRVVGASLRDAQIAVGLTVDRSTDNIFAMSIQSFACSDTEGLFTTGKCRRFVNIKSVAERKLAQLDAAPSLNFMKAPPGNDLKEYDGAWHVRINDQWRLTFKWGESGPYDVLIEDPH
jgi:toxin HigB-1